jgi:predicted nucleic acid-binding protein
MARVFWDTNLFIYFLERTPSLGTQARELRRRMLQRGDQLVTSALTLGEILVHPVQHGRHDLEQRYIALFTPPAVSVLEFGMKAAPVYARVRQDRTIQKPDALQLACAAAYGVDLFITNDERLSRKTVPGIHFICSLAAAPL